MSPSSPPAVESLPRLCLIAPIVAEKGDRVVSQAEVMEKLFVADGYSVRSTSSILNRPLRLADILVNLVRWRRHIDVVVISVFSGAGFVVADLAGRLGRSLGKPVVLCLRGGNLPRFAAGRPGWVRSVLQRASAVVAPSEYLADAFWEWADVHVIPNVIDLDNYPYHARRHVEPRLLWMRTFEPLYNPEMAVRALALLAPELPGASLTLAGQPGESLGSCRTLVHELGLQDRVSFAGFLRARSKIEHLLSHDVYVHTSRIDNMPVSVVEAAACGLPIVATRVGGMPWLLAHEESALLVDSERPDQLAGAVSRLISDPALATRLSAGARQLAERSAWPSVRAQWDSLFAELAARGP